MELDDLVRAAASGDERAWARMARLLSPRLRGYFVARCRGLDSKDLIQDTLMVVSTKLPDFEMRSEAAFIAWVHKIAQFVALAALRQLDQTEKLSKRLGQNERTPSPKLSTLLDRAERLEMVLREVKNLPASYRLAIENVLDDGDAKDLAALAGIERVSARVTESRAFARLRERLRPSTPNS